MQVSSRNSPGGGTQRRLRKGTRSCVECRRRKIRCIPRLEDASTCNECFARGVRCRDQAHRDAEPFVNDPRPNLRERVARLEQLMDRVISNGAGATQNLGLTERDAAETLENLRAEPIPNTPSSNASSSLYVNNDDHAPVLSLFNNAVLSRDAAPRVATASEGEAPQHTDTLVDGGPFMERLQHKRRHARQALLSLLPASPELTVILGYTSSWWDTWRRLFPEIAVDETHRSLREYVFWAISQENPITVAVAVLCVALSIRQIRPGVDDSTLDLRMSPKDMLDQSMQTIDRLLIADDDFAGTVEGVELMVLQGKNYINLGQPRKGWVMLRRAISFAHLVGLHPSRKMAALDVRMSTKRRAATWWGLYEVDRYISLLLGLPHAMNDETDVGVPGLHGSTETLIYRRKLALVAGRIIERTQSTLPPSYSAAMDLDQRMNAEATKMPVEWWDVGATYAAGKLNVDELFERLGTQVWHHQIKSFLHLPFMLESANDARFKYNRLACLEASRGLIQLYLMLRQDTPGAFYIAKIFDFQGFTAAVLLLLNLLGYGRIAPSHDEGQEEKDWKLVDTVRDTLRRACADEEWNSMAEQALQVLEVLSAARHDQGPRVSGKRLTGNTKLVIPYFGTITIAPGKIFSPSTATASPQVNATPGSFAAGVGLSEDATGRGPNLAAQTAQATPPVAPSSIDDVGPSTTVHMQDFDTETLVPRVGPNKAIPLDGVGVVSDPTTIMPGAIRSPVNGMTEAALEDNGRGEAEAEAEGEGLGGPLDAALNIDFDWQSLGMGYMDLDQDWNGLYLGSS